MATSDRGNGRAFLRGQTWWIAYYAPQPDGTTAEIRESAKTADEQVARDLLTDRIHAVRNHRQGIRTSRGRPPSD